MPRRDEKTWCEQWSDLRSDYNMARSNRFRRDRMGVGSMPHGADYHVRSEGQYLRMIEYARAMDRDDSIVSATIGQAVNNILQDGIPVDPTTGDHGADIALKERWTDYTTDPEQCDYAGESDYLEITKLACRHTLLDGDVLALPTYEGPLQLIEGHRLRTPDRTRRNVVLGILLDQYRRRLEYWIARDEIEPGRSVRVGDVKQYPTRDDAGNRQVFHVYNPKRVSQTRGISALAPIVDLLAMHEDIQFARLIQQQVVSCFAIFRERALNFEVPGAEGQTGERTTEVLPDGSTRTTEGYAPGMQLRGLPGEKLMGFSPNVPNPEFFPHIKLILQLIGVNLGLPLVLVLMDASETNFSGWRGAIDQARLGFVANQKWLIARLIRPDYLRKVRQWMAEDSALRSIAGRSGVNLFRCRFKPPRWPYIEPLKDAMADDLRRRRLLTSPSQQQAERGGDWEDVATEIVEDNAFAIRRAMAEADAINREFPSEHPITWRDVLFLTPDNIRLDLDQMEAVKGDKESAV